MTALSVVQKTISELAGWFGAWTKTEVATGIAALVSVVIALAKLADWGKERLKGHRDKKHAEQERRKLACQSFTRQMLADARKCFIEPRCSNLDPTKEVDMRASVGVQEPVLEALDRELVGGHMRHILILADSGMGKTTLLANLLDRDLSRAPSKRRGFVLISLARDDAMERMAKVPEKGEKILLLDAFDEDALAISDHKARLAELLKAARDFSAIVLTCRTQFFPSEEEIPREVGVLSIGPRPAGEDQGLVFRKIYLLPYGRAQVSRYLRHAIPWWRPRSRRSAFALVGRIGDLATRPMLLGLVPRLAQAKREMSELFELYEFMVEQWFQRENTWIARDTLREASKLIAVDMVLNRHARGAECVSSEELEAIVRPLERRVPQWKLQARSLLNRDSSGRLKFSHRSIMEYFFVVAAIEGAKATLKVPWTALMRDFFFSWGRCAGGSESLEIASSFFQADLSATGLFPLSGRREADAVSADALVECLRLPVPHAVARGFPAAWRSLATRLSTQGSFVVVSDRADNLSWTVPRLPKSQAAAAAGPLFNFDSIYGTQAEPVRDPFPWRIEYPGAGGAAVPGAHGGGHVPTLREFTALALQLAHANRLAQLLSPQELYWLRNEPGNGRHLVNVRLRDEPSTPAPADFHAEILASVEHSVRGKELAFTLYRSMHRKGRGVLIETKMHEEAGSHAEIPRPGDMAATQRTRSPARATGSASPRL